MYCPKCGALNPDHARLCRACGQVMTPGTPDDQVARPRIYGLAIAAMALGILTPFTCGLTALPAIILGIVALVKIGGSHGRLRGTGMAIVGIVAPIIILPLAMGFLMPALARTRQLAFRMTCATNLQGLGKAMYLYANDNNDRFPTPSKWCDLLGQHEPLQKAIFRCRGGDEGPCNYAMNKAVEGLGTNAPPDMVLLFETAPGWNQAGGAEILTIENHLGTGCNVLFVDAHVEFVKPERLPQLRWTPDASLTGQPVAGWFSARPAAAATD